MHQFSRLVRYFSLVQRGQMDNRLTDISIHRALSIAMSLAYSFYQGPKNTCNAKSNNSKNDLGSHKDNNVSLQKHTQKKQCQLHTHPLKEFKHQMKAPKHLPDSLR